MNVKQRAEAIGTFRYIEVRLMETAALWVPLTPEMEVKVLLGRHIFDFAQHADWLGKRAFELRQPEHFTRKANDAYTGLLDSLKEARSTGEKLSSLYDVILPGLIRRYEMYVANTDALLDAPSVLIMQRIATDLRRQIEDATQLRIHLDIATPSISGLRQKDDAISTVVA
jgi:hypothetical protein